MGDRKEPTVQGEKNNRGKFSQFDRVRVKFGANRGHYGTIVYVGGDDGTYYGVKLDCEKNAIGYSEYELERDNKPGTC